MSRLPDGHVAVLRPDLLRRTDGLLVGGSPLRALRLSDRARNCVDRDRVVVRDAASAALAARLLDGNLATPEPHGPDVDPAALTVVIPVRDRPEQLDRCLSALTGLRVVVVDDASRDRAVVMEVAACRGVALLALDDNVGPAAARNVGLARVCTPYVAFVDSDVEVPTAELLGLAKHFADPRVALVGPLIRGRSRSRRPRWFERYDEAASSLDLGRRGANVRPRAEVAWLPSACMVGRVDRLRAAGGFDERLRVGEDVDLVWRLVGAGDVVRYDPGRIAHHDTRPTVRGWLGRKFFYGTGGAELAKRHGDWTAPAGLGAATAIGAAAVLARSRWSLPIAAATVLVNTRALHRKLPDAPRRRVPLAVDVSLRGLGWGIRQESALLLRHWWPATVVVAMSSRRLRRAIVSAVLIDVMVAAAERPEIDPVTAAVARRFDDLAYGAGLWLGAVRARSARCLLPRRSVTSSKVYSATSSVSG